MKEMKLDTRVPADDDRLRNGEFIAKTQCDWCKHPFDDGKFKKCYDHDHITGNYRSAACNQCNLRLRQKRNTLVVVFHNFRGYDSHALCLKGLVSKPDWDVHTIAQNPEKYLALTATLKIGKSSMKVRFIDSLQFLNAGLATLVTNLTEDATVNNLKHASKMRDTYPELRQEDISAKGVFPYSFLNSMERLEHPDLPPLADWYDVLEEGISVSEEDIARGREMWHRLGCRNLGEYLLRYLELDCRLLADVFEQFRNIMFSDHKLDPAHYLSLPHFSYDAALKFSGDSIELITIPEMFRDVENAKRGGYSFCNKHWCEAYNPYVNPGTEHDPRDVYLGNIDANNLYGNALRRKFAYADYKYLSPEEITAIDWQTIDTEGDHGYFVVCDLHCPPDVQKKTRNFPLAPETVELTYDMLSPYSKDVNRRKNLTLKPDSQKPDHYSSCRKLIAHFNDKVEYVVHFATLKFYLEMGMEITRIHRVIGFKQKVLFGGFIDFNSEKRANATNTFTKDLYKLMNNSLYGKTIENKRNRIDVKLCTSAHKLEKACSNPRYRTTRIFSDDLSAAVLTKCNVVQEDLFSKLKEKSK